TLTLAPNALGSPTNISMTPLKAPVGTGTPHGTGVEIGPSGLKLPVPGTLTVSGAAGSGRPALLNYDYATAAQVPQFANPLDTGPRSFFLSHFSTYFSVDQLLDDAIAAARFEATVKGAGIPDRMAMLNQLVK